MHYHFVGIGGIGMSALALLKLGQGHKVSGSDLNCSWLVDQLQKKGAKVFIGHKKENMEGADIIIYSTAARPNNPELLEAKKRKLPILHRSELLKELLDGSQALLVAGTHGKTTTSALLAHVLETAGLEPTYAVGGLFNKEGLNAAIGGGEEKQNELKYFVAEADESDGSFLNYKAEKAIVTNVEKDHLEHWGSFAKLKQGFLLFMQNVKHARGLFWCKEDPFLQTVSPAGTSYGFHSADLKAFQIRPGLEFTCYNIDYQGRLFQDVEIHLLGEHNVLNSLAVFGMALSLGIDEKSIRQAFLSFSGIKRRMEQIGQIDGTLFLEDYAHHPTEIKTVLKTLAAISPKPVVCVFQPHRYSRTKQLFGQFAEAFGNADEVIITDVYAAFEKPLKNVNGKSLAQAVQKTHRKAVYAAKETLAKFLAGQELKNKTVLFLGAGDISDLGKQFFKTFKNDIKIVQK